MKTRYLNISIWIMRLRFIRSKREPQHFLTNLTFKMTIYQLHYWETWYCNFLDYLMWRFNTINNWGATSTLTQRVNLIRCENTDPNQKKIFSHFSIFKLKLSWYLLSTEKEGLVLYIIHEKEYQPLRRFPIQERRRIPARISLLKQLRIQFVVVSYLCCQLTSLYSFPENYFEVEFIYEFYGKSRLMYYSNKSSSKGELKASLKQVFELCIKFYCNFSPGLALDLDLYS